MNVCAAAYLHLKCVETNCSNCMKQSQYHTISSNTTCFQMQSSNLPLIHIPLACSQLKKSPEIQSIQASLTAWLCACATSHSAWHSDILGCFWVKSWYIYIYTYHYIYIYISWCFLVHSTFASFQHLHISKAIGTAAPQRPKGIPKGFTWKTVLITPCTSRQSWSWWKQLCGFFDVDAVLLQDIVSHYVLCCHVYGYITISLYVYMSIFLGLCLSLSLSLSPSPVPCGIMWACVIRPVFLGPLCWPQWKIMRCYVQIFDQT